MTGPTRAPATLAADLAALSERATPMPVDEQLYLALTDGGLDEGEATWAVEVAQPILARFLRDLAADAEWKFRSMTLRCGAGESSVRLHPVGALLREHADAIHPRSKAASLAPQPSPETDTQEDRP